MNGPAAPLEALWVSQETMEGNAFSLLSPALWAREGLLEDVQTVESTQCAVSWAGRGNAARCSSLCFYSSCRYAEAPYQIGGLGETTPDNQIPSQKQQFPVLSPR